MSPIDVLFLLAVSAVWGSSFMFMRYLAPAVGPAFTADMRTLLAGIILGGPTKALTVTFLNSGGKLARGGATIS